MPSCTSYGYLQFQLGDLTSAVAFCKRALQVTKQGQINALAQGALICLGHALNGLGDQRAARDYYQHAVDIQASATSTYRLPDAHASFAAFLLSQNELSEAMIHTEAALTIMQQEGIVRADEPFQVYWACVNVLRVNQDPRAEEVLRKAYHALQETANKLGDVMLRYSFLENVVANRNLVAMAQATRIKL